MKNKKANLVAFISSLLLVVVSIPLTSCGPFKIKESVKEYKRNYRFNEIRVAEQNTFRKLNSVTYPSGDSPIKTELGDYEVEAYSNFSNSNSSFRRS